MNGWINFFIYLFIKELMNKWMNDEWMNVSLMSVLVLSPSIKDLYSVVQEL